MAFGQIDKKERERERELTKNNPVGFTYLCLFLGTALYHGASQVALAVKNLPSNAGDFRDTGSVSGLGKSPGEGTGNPLRWSCLENPMDRGAWRARKESRKESDTTESDLALALALYHGFPKGPVVKTRLLMQEM